MKKLLTILVVVTLLLAGCATAPSTPRTVPSTPPSAPSTVPDTSPSADDNRGEVAVASASGRVVDFSTRQPVEKAMVNIGDKSYFTDSLGNYDILEIPVGALTVNVIAPDYEDYSNTVEIEEGSNIIANILLAPETIPPSVSGLLLTYTLTLQEDASNKLHMNLRVRNIKSDSLRMVINGTIVDDYQNVYDLFNITNNLIVREVMGNNLPINFSKTTIVPQDWYLAFMNYPIYYDVINIDTKGNNELIIEYDIISSTDMWSGFGADSNSLFDDPRDFWAGYLEWTLYRPLEHGTVRSAKLIIELPFDWEYATVHPSLGNEIDLGTIDYMYGDNVRWKNYQRSNFILFREGPFRLASKTVRGIKVQDVYSAHVERQRNHEAQYQYFQYLCDNIGYLPVYAVLTFYPSVDGNAIPYLRTYMAGPYGWAHGLMGEFFGTGGDIGLGPGNSLPQVQLWDFNSMDNNKHYSFSMHGTVRYWLLHFIQLGTTEETWLKGGLTIYYENMSVASMYGLDEVVERRFKPMYRYYLDNIAGPPEVDQLNFSNHSFLGYFKTALTTFYIDKLLIEHSEGDKDINDLMRLLFKDASVGIPLSKENFLRNLNSLTDYDFTNVVDDYFYGDKKLNLERWLK